MSKWQLSNRSRGWGATKCVMMQVAGFVLFENQGKKIWMKEKFQCALLFEFLCLRLHKIQNIVYYIKWKEKWELKLGETHSTLWQTDWNFYSKYVCIMMIRTRHFWFLQAQKIAKSSQKEKKQCKIKYNFIIQDAHQFIVNL